ncbi:hypothetical protein TG4357_02680 [Thalassovita gelatinovora]|uniref:Helix-turn-helix domain protein n=1 Tax=Thalassovita gelatinovora TaxID=53501 RepID=A0A0P1FFP1_THAGE|nr:helix-turn-helix domain-containing protein [Thalassovita gelatinovora]CUH66857.1 hypothetical protein TG4357_02680 [Thalassovita gelatinovora]SEQ43995.1 hypothetical protein SAMN04488043_105217 [Thalassovita gelatinovora]
MTKHMPQIAFAPRLMQAAQAAQYLGVSQSTLRTLPIPRKERGGNRLYDRFDLDAYADGLPYEEKAPVAADHGTGITTAKAKPKQWARR